MTSIKAEEITRRNLENLLNHARSNLTAASMTYLVEKEKDRSLMLDWAVDQLHQAQSYFDGISMAIRTAGFNYGEKMDGCLEIFPV